MRMKQRPLPLPGLIGTLSNTRRVLQSLRFESARSGVPRPVEGEADVYRTVQDLQSRLQEAEELLRAIRSGDVDEVVVTGPLGDQVYARHITVPTERQRQELKAAAYQAKLLENVHDAILATDDRFVLKAWNSAAEKIYGWKADEVLGRRVGDVIHADFTNAQRSEALRTLARTGHCVVEVAQYTRDGKQLWMEGHITALRDESGDIIGYVAAYRDITERKRAEDDLRRSESNLADAQKLSHTGSWSWNAATRQLHWSLEHFRICGVDLDTFKPTIESVRQLIHPQDLPAWTQTFEKAVDKKREFDHEFRIVRPSGTVRHVHSIAHPVVNESGDVTEYVGTIMDVTERRIVDEERAGLLRQIVQAQEDERRRIALEMHDQFGQQLSALILKLSALRREPGRRTALGEQLASLEAMTRQLDTDLELIVSRLRPPALDDLGLVAALTNYMKRWSEHFAIPADIHASGVQPDRLRSDIDTALYRVMQEALNNIAKHARATHVAILLDWRPDRVSLIVEDDGVGFDVQQPDGPRQRFGVVGMRERATLAGGTLDIESHQGKGTTVVARIPLSSSPEGTPT
jgi:PAS domain S-box-containing protein